MFRSTLLLYIAIATSTMCLANDHTEVPTSLKVYRIGNIASAAAMKATLSSKSTNDEWTTEYIETIKALDETQEIITSLCQEKPVSVTVYAPLLSLIVRHTENGHMEIAELLDQLGAIHGPLIQMEITPVATESSEETKAGFAKLPSDEQQRYFILNGKSQLTKAETEELHRLTERGLGSAALKETVLLKPGQRTPFELSAWPATAMARMNHEKGTIDIRVDAVSDDIGEIIPFTTKILSLAEGESGRFFHIADGGFSAWRVTAKEVPPPASDSRMAALLDELDEATDDGEIQELAILMPQRFAPNGTDAENAREDVRASIVLHQHIRDHGEGVYSLGAQLENLSMTHYARIEFNAMESKLELFGAQDRAIPVGPEVMTGPIPQTQVAIIPPGSYVVLSMHYPGIGLNGEKMRLGAGGQVWMLAVGTYRMRGTIPVNVQFATPHFDEAHRGIALPPESWSEKNSREHLNLHLSEFTVR